MDAYVQQIRGGVVRVGAGKPPNPYLYSVTYDDQGAYALIVGFYRKKIKRAEFVGIIRAINAASGKLVEYYREREPPSHAIQIDPALTGGKIIMRKIK